MTLLPESAIKEFQELHEEVFGTSIRYEDAQHEFVILLRLIELTQSKVDLQNE